MLSLSVAALGFQAPVAPVPASVSAVNMMDKSGLETLAKDLNPVRTQPRPRALFFPDCRRCSSRFVQIAPSRPVCELESWRGVGEIQREGRRGGGGGGGGGGVVSVGCRGGCVWGTSQLPPLHFFCLEDLSPYSNLP